MDVTRYIKESCEHQQATTPQDFIGMARAYEIALQAWCRPRTDLDLIDLSGYISRVLNKRWVYFRSTPATFANGTYTTLNNPNDIGDALGRLIFNHTSAFVDLYELINPYSEATDKEIIKFHDERNALAKEFYFAFEEIHPWPDGNGRVGSLLFNLLNGSILNPIHPPQKAKWVQPHEDLVD